MKKGMFIILLVISTVFLYADLIDVYKKGPIELIPDPDFGKNTNWEELFSDFHKVVYGNPVGNYKNITIADDGSIFISNYSQYSIYKFDKNGNFVKRFGKKGNKPGEFIHRPQLSSILDNKYLIVREYHGRIHLFDLDGNFIKVMKMDYAVIDCIALKNNKIGVVGPILLGKPKVKYYVAIKDVETEEEKGVTFYMWDKEKGPGKTVSIEKGRHKFIFGPFERIKNIIARSRDGNLIVGVSTLPDIIVYSPEGKKLKSFGLSIIPLKVTEKIKEEYFEGIEKTIQKYDLPESVLKEVKSSPDFFQEHMPYYYDLLVDSDGNILVFPFKEENEQYKFRVYSPEGKFICESGIDPGKYKLRIHKKIRPLAFFKGDLFVLAALKESESIPLRLIKVNLKDIL